jgi:hypothetical protein
VSTGSQASSDPEPYSRPDQFRENSDAPAPLGKDPPGGGPVVTPGRATKRLNTTVDWPLRVLAIAIVVILVCFANFAQPVQRADVTPQLNPSLYIGPYAVTGGGHVDQGSVPLQVTGVLTGAGGFVSALELDTRPSGGSSPWQNQRACCTLLGSSFTGSASLSVASAQAFDFQLVSTGNNIVLATGTVTVHLESFPGGSQRAINIIGGLGAAAVLLEVLRLWRRRRTGPKPAPPTT